MKGQCFQRVTTFAFRKGGGGWKVIMTSETALRCSVSSVYTIFLKLFTTFGMFFDEDTLSSFAGLCLGCFGKEKKVQSGCTILQ